jgi:hypothetical protein
MAEEDKRSLTWSLAFVAILVGAIGAIVQVRSSRQSDWVPAALLVLLATAGVFAWQNRASLRQRIALLPWAERIRLLVAAAAALAVLSTVVLLWLSRAQGPPLEVPPPLPPPGGTDDGTTHRKPGQPDPSDPHGIPLTGDGSTLATYHQQANSRSVLAHLPDGDGVRAYLQSRPYLPVFRNYCRIDPYAGVLALQIVPSGDRVLVTRQGSANSVLGRAQRTEPALRDVDVEAATTWPASVACAAKSCKVSFEDGTAPMTIAWNETPQDVFIEQKGDKSAPWADCRCRFSGSFVTCKGVEEPLNQRPGQGSD